MRNRRNYYRLLQVQPDAPVEVIRASFRVLMRELKQHPDLGGDTWTATLLNEAYATLSDPTQRAQYDRKLFGNARKTAPPSNTRASVAESVCPICNSTIPRTQHSALRCAKCGSLQPRPQTLRQRAASRRGLERVKRDAPIRYCSSWPQEPREGRMIDLSPKGMRFLTGEHLPVGSRLKISGPNFHSTAVVVNVSAVRSGTPAQYAIGVSFLATEFEERTGSFLSANA